MTKKILIADDEKRIRILLSDFLIAEGYRVIEASNGRDAVDLFTKDSDIDLIILDLMMPVLDGLEACKQIRGISDVPIIMLTAKNTDQDELNGYISGTDAYIKKPFNPMILVAKVNALIKRPYLSWNKPAQYGQLIIDSSSRSVSLNNQKIDLSQTEYKLLTYLIANEGHALSREQLLNTVWGYSYEGSDRTIDTHMNRLRSKLNLTSEYIHTVWGIGYKFEVK